MKSCKNCHNILICSVRDKFVEAYDEKVTVWTLGNNDSESWEELAIYLAKYCENYVKR